MSVIRCLSASGLNNRIIDQHTMEMTMKTTFFNKRFIILSMIMLVAGSCGKVRELPVDKIITLYNSNLQETRNMQMLDTLHVKLGGLSPGVVYTVEALDPENKQITFIKSAANNEGIIGPAALWYDVGIKNNTANDGVVPDIGGNLTLSAFTIRVSGPDGTDYSEPFYIVTTASNVGDRPSPIVWATNSAIADQGFENAFEETGTADKDGVAGKTKVYVEARNLAGSINGTTISSVDIYVMSSKPIGQLWETGDLLSDLFITRKLDVAVVVDSNGGKKLAQPELIWDLDSPLSQLINPGERNTAYDIIVDVNRNGVFDLGEDLDADGVTDAYTDGVDGQGVVGFIVTNTAANDFYITIHDANGNKIDTVDEAGSELHVSMYNLPSGSTPVLNIYEQFTTTKAMLPGDLGLTVTTADITHPLDYVDDVLAVNTASTILTNIANANTKAYDLVISGISGMDQYKKVIKVIHVKAALFTSDGIIDSNEFDETGTSSGLTKVYARTEGLGLTGATVSLYIFPHIEGWTDGIDLGGYFLKTNTSVNGTGNLDATLLWDLDNGPELINPSAENNVYDIVLDADNNGVYVSGVDTVSSIAFIVRDTAANSLANVYYVNIASGGIYSDCPRHWDCFNLDYRDNFDASGSDTKSYPAYGIKAIWNPYVRDSRYGSLPAEDGSPSLYVGNMVDVYIVDATVADLSAGAVLGSGPNADVSGGVESLPVQYSCKNGAFQQNIWTPNFTAGSYYVIVDIDRDGKLTEGVDLVDAVLQDGTTILEDPSVVGFSVN